MVRRLTGSPDVAARNPENNALSLGPRRWRQGTDRARRAGPRCEQPELENDAGDDQAIEDLVATVDARGGQGTHAYVDTGVVGTDAIRVGPLYKPAVVRMRSSSAT